MMHQVINSKDFEPFMQFTQTRHEFVLELRRLNEMMERCNKKKERIKHLAEKLEYIKTQYSFKLQWEEKEFFNKYKAALLL